ncbi:MAG: hypothetical protein IGQ88_07915 [Gloeomargaritaceae cyanobacterium C42_A2020_066]|nr:hypothetical protein [Gloeomargaritaceae cyanobacterium C42_A2020_066]
MSKAQPIDLHTPYPCPICRRAGQLEPITLTDALGCQRCQHIFVVNEQGYVLEQLATLYPYKRAWIWTGRQWQRLTHPWGRPASPLSLIWEWPFQFTLIFLVSLLLLIWLILGLLRP